MDCSPPGSSVHRILQARILEWVTIPFSQGIFSTQGSNPGLLHCRQILYSLNHQEGFPVNISNSTYPTKLFSLNPKLITPSSFPSLYVILVALANLGSIFDPSLSHLTTNLSANSIHSTFQTDSESALPSQCFHHCLPDPKLPYFIIPFQWLPEWSAAPLASTVVKTIL